MDADDIVGEMEQSARSISEELGKLDALDDNEKDNLYRQIGLAALKYFLLKVDARKNMLFDPKESIDFNGNTGPFIQYAHARIQSLLRKAESDFSGSFDDVSLEKAEIQLAVGLAQFPQVVETTAANHSPAELSNYLYDLVKDYNHFYQSLSVLKEEREDHREFRVVLSQAVSKVIATGLGLLGIEAPQRM